MKMKIVKVILGVLLTVGQMVAYSAEANAYCRACRRTVCCFPLSALPTPKDD